MHRIEHGADFHLEQAIALTRQADKSKVMEGAAMLAGITVMLKEEYQMPEVARILSAYTMHMMQTSRDWHGEEG